MSGCSRWLGLASGHKCIYSLRLSHGASMQQETKRASYFLTRVRIKQSTTVISIVALYNCTQLRFKRGLAGLEAGGGEGIQKRRIGMSVSQLFPAKRPCCYADTEPGHRHERDGQIDIPGLAAGYRLQYKIVGLQILLNCPLQEVCNFPLLATLHQIPKLP